MRIAHRQPFILLCVYSCKQQFIVLLPFDFSRYRYVVFAISFALLLSCKHHISDLVDSPVDPPHVPTRHILLKDIIVPNIPSPHYHFEYNTDSLVTHVDFESEYTRYDVLYSNGRISEMRNNIFINHDTLRYSYDNAGKLTLIKFINDANIVYRHAFFTYNGNLIKEVKWDRKQADGSFFTDRILSFSFYADGNVKTITDHQPAVPGVDDYISVKTFEHYDDKVNVDDFSLVHLGIHDHLFLLQGFRLQKNNPRKEMLSVNGTDFYTIDYTYTYNNDNTPSNKAGSLLYLNGQYAGQRFQTNTFYTYY